MIEEAIWEWVVYETPQVVFAVVMVGVFVAALGLATWLDRRAGGPRG